MADLFEGPLNRIAGMLGAKSGAQLGAENKAKLKKDADDARIAKETAAASRSPGTAIQQSRDTLDMAMKELNLQNKRYAPGQLPGSQ